MEGAVPIVIVLGIETATERVGVAVADRDGVRAQFEATRGRRHAETVAPAIGIVCREADIGIEEISAIAVDVGPGLFTGLRVGLATGKSLAQALGVPMVGLTSLEVLAHPLRYVTANEEQTVVAVVDGRKGQVFYSFFRVGDGLIRRVSEPVAGSIDDLVADIEDRAQDVMCVGDGARRYLERLDDCRFARLTDDSLDHPAVSALVHLARSKVSREEGVDQLAIGAMYLRPPDAEINWQTRTSV
ncbi:MAG: tRNA (adenosine(37)-N6)-threonylcarbamoyltransferase complex dimerization subunit type 1 TsaB [Ilumatobacteraceae bacterium]